MQYDDLQHVLEYRVWSRERVLACVDAVPGATFSKPMGSSFPSLRDTLVHIHSADRIWISRLKGFSPAEQLQPADFPNVPTLRTRWAQLDAELGEAAERPAFLDPGRTVTYQTLDGGGYRQPLGQIIQHMVNHQTYHFGQVATLLRQLGAIPAAIDLAIYDRTADGTAAK